MDSYRNFHVFFISYLLHVTGISEIYRYPLVTIKEKVNPGHQPQ